MKSFPLLGLLLLLRDRTGEHFMCYRLLTLFNNFFSLLCFAFLWWLLVKPIKKIKLNWKTGNLLGCVRMKLLNLQSIASVQGGTFHLMSCRYTERKKIIIIIKIMMLKVLRKESRTQLISLIFRRVYKRFSRERTAFTAIKF